MAPEAVRPLADSFVSALAEARRVSRLYSMHGKQLRAVKIDTKLAGAIPNRMAVLAEAQNALVDRVRPVKTKEEKALTEEAVALRSELFATLEWAFRDGSLDKQLAAVRQGEGLDDLTDDLEQLASLGAKNGKGLSVSKTAGKQVKRAGEVAGKLAELVADRRSIETDTDATDLRNRAATWLEDAVREVRAAGRFAFRDDPDVQALFRAPRSRPRPAGGLPG